MHAESHRLLDGYLLAHFARAPVRGMWSWVYLRHRFESAKRVLALAVFNYFFDSVIFRLRNCICESVVCDSMLILE